MIKTSDYRIAIVGLGYVGLPLAVEFGKLFETIGFDTNNKRISDLIQGRDLTLEVESSVIKESHKLSFTNNVHEIKKCNIYIITVPTPIDKENKPDLSPLINASTEVGRIISKNDLIIYESTVYPGATEEVCVPILERNSGLKFNRDFFCGYSPERINPGDKLHRLTSIVKVTSGSTIEIAETVDKLYKSIIKKGTYKAESIKIAEAAKIIENTQRDVNIGLINELAIIFDKLQIDTEAVLKAAETKWNFLSFRPGLVGGHCIGVDPYYLTHKAIEVGYEPEIILSGRRLNDRMGAYIVSQVVSLMKEKSININDSNVLIMGLAFKENCPDLRNTRVTDLVDNLEKLNCNVDIYDPLVDKNEALEKLSLTLIEEPEFGTYDAIILAVAHSEFKKLSEEKIRLLGKKKHLLFDIKYLLKPEESDGRL